MRTMITCLAGLVCAVAAASAGGQARMTDERVLEESASGENWFLKGGSFRGEHYSPLGQVDDDNVGDLGLAWAADIDIPDGIATTPIVVDGVVYIGGAYSIVYAVDAATGKVLWRHDPEVLKSIGNLPNYSWRARASRGIAVWDGKVYLTTADCKLTALDAATGRPVWSKVTCDTSLYYSISDSPYVGGGKVFVGTSGSETPMKTRGYMSAYDAASGDLVWRFYVVPSDNPAENDTPALKMAAKTWSVETLAKYGGGGHPWNEMTYDPVSNQLFFGTSGAYPYRHDERAPEGGDNLFLSSIVAVDAGTGEYRWHYQTVDKDSWDYNATMNIVVADLRIDDKNRETVLIAPKNGFHYALDRHTGELLTAGKFSKVNWATHINMETGRPVYDDEGAYWDLPEGESTFVWPNMWGSHSWHPMAFHPGLGLSYIPVADVPALADRNGDGEDIVMLTEVNGRPHAPGKLVAFDPVRQQIRWSVDQPLPFNGGLMATAGNLVFQGNANGRFEAFAADDGEKLWSVQTGSSINAAPASYAIDGTQYIVIPVGAGGGLQFLYPEMHSTKESQGPTRLMAFALEGRAAMPPAGAGYPPLPDQPKLDADAETIAKGKAAYADNCKFCHGQEGRARFGGTVPDLRYANAETHLTWQGIVIGGARAANGMPAIEIPAEESEAIRSYVLSLSEQIRNSR
ncbi:MAG: PQQ-dependent dehydrogenase, methanol/ethanol family [Gammaproteobacteria bacterium]|nr:PQQ-dependent dehydrogenase, methanol/ethanol family [Gammaproteobacteria bacterium]